MFICMFGLNIGLVIKLVLRDFSFVFRRNGIRLKKFLVVFLEFVKDVSVCFLIMFILLESFMGIKFVFENDVW